MILNQQIKLRVKTHSSKSKVCIRFKSLKIEIVLSSVFYSFMGQILTVNDVLQFALKTLKNHSWKYQIH